MAKPIQTDEDREFLRRHFDEDVIDISTLRVKRDGPRYHVHAADGALMDVIYEWSGGRGPA